MSASAAHTALPMLPLLGRAFAAVWRCVFFCSLFYYLHSCAACGEVWRERREKIFFLLARRVVSVTLLSLSAPCGGRRKFSDGRFPALL